MQSNWTRQTLLAAASAPGGPPFIGMHVLPPTLPTSLDVVVSGENDDNAMINFDESIDDVLTSSKSKAESKTANRTNGKKQLSVATSQWLTSAITGPAHNAIDTTRLSCEPCDHKTDNSSYSTTGTLIADRTSLIPLDDCLNRHKVTAQPEPHAREIFERRAGSVVQQMQPASSTSDPDVCRSDVDRLKRLHYFTSQQARSVEELTRRHRKLDHLQRCLKRYEIERCEAGQAVRRIEDRIKELQDRTSDLLSSAASSPGQIDFKMSFDTKWPSNWNDPVVGDITTMGQPMVQTHSSGCSIIPPLGPVGRRTSCIVRKPSKHRPEDPSIQVTANHMYVDSEQMLRPTPIPEVYPHVLKLLGQVSPRTTSTDVSSPIAVRCHETQVHDATISAASVPMHNAHCGCSQQQQISLAQKRIAELEARHKTLVEHLNLQRNRLAAADATVVSLARTLLQFTMMNDLGKASENSTPNTDRPDGLIDPYQKPIYLPQSDLVGRPRNNPLPGSMDSLSRLEASEARQQNGFAGPPIPLPNSVSSSSMDPIGWTQAPIRQSRKQPIRDTQDLMTKNANEYIDLAATDSVDPGVELNGCKRNNDSKKNIDCTSNNITVNNTDEKNTDQPRYGAIMCNRLPNYFASTNQLPGSVEHSQPVFAGYFLHPAPPTAPWIPAPPLPPKPSQRDASDADEAAQHRQLQSQRQDEEEERTIEDEEVTQYMCRQQEPQQQPQNEQQQASSNSLTGVNGTHRPPPPPYYVNLFGSDNSNTANRFTQNSKQHGRIRRSEKRQKSIESRVTTSTTTQSSSSRTNKTSDTFSEMHQPGQRNVTSDDEFPKGNAVEIGKKLTQPTAPQNQTQGMLVSRNLLAYLEGKGHDTKELSCELQQPNDSAWSRMVTPSISCFNSKVARWFRSGLGGSIRSKPRHHSMDDKDTITISTPFWQWTGELRVRLIDTRCEGFLWMRNQHTLHQSQQTTQKSHPWHSLRVTYRAWSDAGTQSGDSPSCSKSGPVCKWRQSQWTRYWFVCDVPGQVVTYQDAHKIERIKGSFRFSEIRQVQPGLGSKPGLLASMGEETPVRHQSDPEGAFDYPPQEKQSRLNRPLYKHKTQTADWLQEPQKSTADGVSRNVDELDQLVFRLETWMRVYVLKATSPALRNLWMDVFQYATQFNGT
ncbi:hypothetical protein FGIG_02026 [Fasciola gigantica]|uniref:PH domain-containing protein n=1 Tax=Fasciola gigantica TaxID=46835 RepID=A0A504YI01_FASGI|nr:hypothetical protein FGIG_02026 [Fasciola gigantica]